MKLEYEKKGCYLVKNAINADQVKSLIDTLRIFEKEINHYDIRDLMNKVPEIRELALSDFLLPVAKKYLAMRQNRYALYFSISCQMQTGMLHGIKIPL